MDAGRSPCNWRFFIINISRLKTKALVTIFSKEACVWHSNQCSILSRKTLRPHTHFLCSSSFSLLLILLSPTSCAFHWLFKEKVGKLRSLFHRQESTPGKKRLLCRCVLLVGSRGCFATAVPSVRGCFLDFLTIFLVFKSEISREMPTKEC